MAGWQQVVIVGNLGKDVEVHQTKSGKTFYTFSVAVNENRKVNDEKIDETTWYDVAIWEEYGATLAQYLVKGKQVMVQGKPGSRAWKTKDGLAMSTLTISARHVQLLGNSGQHRNDGDWFAEQEDAHSGSVDTAAGDVPF